MDEKVREKLRCSLERINQLEEELAKAQEEAVKAKVEKQSSITENGDLKEENDANSLFKLSITESEVQEMKTLIEKQSDELLSSRVKIQELTNKIKEIEDQFRATEIQLVQVKDENFKLKDSLRENNAQKKDQEQRISTLEDRYLNSQRESTGLHDTNEKLNHEIKNKEAQMKLLNEKIDALKEKLELTEQKLSQLELSKKQETLIKEASENHEDKDHQLSLEERIARLESQLEEKSSELQRARQREKMNEEHNQRLSATVDKLLAESNERLQLHLKERMSALEEKNNLQQELEKTRKQLDETQTEKQKGLLEQSKLRTEMDALKQDIQDIQQYKTDQYQPSFLGKGYKKSAISLYHEKEWDRVESSLSNNLANNHNLVSHQPAYDASESDSVQTDDNTDSLFSSMDGYAIQNNSSQNEAQALALMLQEQLDAINKEIRLIQEEKQNTEQRTEELESQVGSIDSIGILSRAGSRPYESQPHLIGSSPTHSEKSSPKPTRISPNSRDYLSQLIMPSDFQQQQSIYAQLLPSGVHSDQQLSDSSNYEDLSPGTPRAIRLQRAQQLQDNGSNYSIPDVLPR